jgi:hypothetical protein
MITARGRRAGRARIAREHEGQAEEGGVREGRDDAGRALARTRRAEHPQPQRTERERGEHRHRGRQQGRQQPRLEARAREDHDQQRRHRDLHDHPAQHVRGVRRHGPEETQQLADGRQPEQREQQGEDVASGHRRLLTPSRSRGRSR